MRTKLRETFDKESYEALNARITDVVYGPHQFVISLDSSEQEHVIKPITNGVGNPLRDLMSLLGVEDLSEIEGQFVRLLRFDWKKPLPHLDTKVQGLAHIIEDRCMLLSDYERQARLMPDPDAVGTELPLDDDGFPVGWEPPALKKKPPGWSDTYTHMWQQIVHDGGTSAEAHAAACDAVATAAVAQANGNVTKLYNVPPFAMESGDPPTQMTDRFTKAYNAAWFAARKRDADINTAHYFACRAVLNANKPDLGNPEIFTMASIIPPPGGAWVILKKQFPLTYDLYSEGLDEILARDVDERLVKWLVEEARIAHYQGA